MRGWGHPASRVSLSDFHTVEFDDRGIKNFNWPVAREELIAVRDRFIGRIVPLTRERFPVADRMALVVLFKAVILELLVRYNIAALESRSSDIALGPGGIHRPQQREGPLERVRQGLLEGPPRDSLIPFWLKKVVRDVEWNGFGPSALRLLGREEGVAAFDPPPLLIRHARATETPIRFTSAREWFGSPERTSDLGVEHDPIAMAVADSAYEAVRGAASETLSTLTLRTLQEDVRQCLGLVTFHLNSGRERDDLPSRLWHGTGGNVWTALLSHLVRESGGRSVGFDHGHGNGYMLPNSRQFIEFPHCDVFVTYNQAQADAVCALTNSQTLVAGHMPRIVASKSVTTEAETRGENGLSRYSHPLRRIMYVSTIYAGLRVHLFPLLPDPVVLDWQARLFARLRSWGFDVLHKPHPESALTPAHRMAEYFGHEVVLGSFEDVMERADAFLFDYPFSTTFPVALMSDQPVFLIDFDYPPWFPRAREEFERRCGVIPGWLDEQNRAQVNWTALRDALEADEPEWDMRFVRSFHS